MRAPLRFALESITGSLAKGGSGDAFQLFVHECFLERFPHLHRYPTAGRDGCIDLCWPADQPTDIFECKWLPEDGCDAAIKSWRKLAEKLTTQLCGPEPQQGERQYGPWYRADHPIKHFRFCISSLIKNQSQWEALNSEIRGFFVGLGTRNPALQHLCAIDVSIHDWSDFDAVLKARPGLTCRWFPSASLSGLRAFGNTVEPSNSFRSWLTSDQLPYYSRSEHLALHPAPAGARLLGEAALLDELGTNGTTGLIVTGAGGFGKTRLMLELADKAESRGWNAFHVVSRHAGRGIQQLLEDFITTKPILLLIDYVERTKEFAELVEDINEINATRGVSIYYVACCRTSYYTTIRTTPSHVHVDLVMRGAAMGSWLATYREKTVAHIVAQAGLANAPGVIAAARGLPVLAAFAAWLDDRGRKAELESLINEQDFGSWAIARMKQSFPVALDGGSVALIFALVPLRRRDVPSLDRSLQAQLQVLCSDGWLVDELLDGTENAWAAAHDVFADKIVTSYMADNHALVTSFVTEVWKTAERLGALDAPLVAFRRIRDRPELNDVAWLDTVAAGMTRAPAAWRMSRLALMQSALLEAPEVAILLRSFEELWQGAESDWRFHNTLGWCIGQIVEINDPDNLMRRTFTAWLTRAMPYAESSNYLLSKALSFDPPLMKELALRWMTTRPRLFQTSYLLVSWLKLGLPIDDVLSTTEQWLARHPLTEQTSFVVQAWLDANGSPDVVRDSTRIWLDGFGLQVEASYVLRAWLNETGETDVVADAVADWLSEHAARPEASHVLTSWLGAKGRPEHVAERMETWLSSNVVHTAFTHVFCAWLSAGGAHAPVLPLFRRWLITHANEREAQYALKVWLAEGGDPDVVSDAVTVWLAVHGTQLEADFLLTAWLRARGACEHVETRFSDWLLKYGSEERSSYLLSAWLNAQGRMDLVTDSVRKWLDKHVSSSALGASHLLKAWLNAGGDTELVKEPLREYLTKHQFVEASSHVLTAWLRAGGSKDLIEPIVRDFLAKAEAGSEPPDFVINAWLKGGGELSLVQSAVATWVQANGARYEAGRMMEAWLSAGGGLAVVAPAVQQWLSLYGQTKRAKSIVAKIATRGESAPFITTLLQALLLAGASPHTLSVLANIRIHYRSGLPLSRALSLAEALNASDVRFVPRAYYSLNFVAILVGLVDSEATDEERKRIDLLLVDWFLRFIPNDIQASGAVKTRAENIRTVELLRYALERNLLRVDRDRQIVARFLRWLHGWPVDARERIASQIEALASTYHSKIWSVFSHACDTNQPRTGEEILAAHAEAKIVSAFVLGPVPGGLMACVNGWVAFIPLSMIGDVSQRGNAAYTGQRFGVIIDSVELARRRMVVSRKAALERVATLRANLQPGATFDGVVVDVLRVGVVVDLGGFTGLLQAIRWGSLIRGLQLDQAVRVSVIGVGQDGSVSLRLVDLPTRAAAHPK